MCFVLGWIKYTPAAITYLLGNRDHRNCYNNSVVCYLAPNKYVVQILNIYYGVIWWNFGYNSLQAKHRMDALPMCYIK